MRKLVSLLLLLVSSALIAPWLWPVIKDAAAPDEDVKWRITRVNGISLPPVRYNYDVKNGQVIGGYDGCNDWGYEDRASGMIISDAQGCDAKPHDDLYWKVAKVAAFPRAWNPGNRSLSG